MIARPLRAAFASCLITALAACSAESPSAPSSFEPQASHAGNVPNFGAKASGSELATPGIVVDGGPGSASASISQPNFSASATFAPGATYLPELRASSTNTTASNSDDITQAVAEAYQLFTSSTAQTVTLDVVLSAVVVDGSTDVSGVLADVWVYGGPGFEATDSPLCPDLSLARFTFDGTYLCGTRHGRANLFIPVGDVVLPGPLTFDLAAGETFAVYAILRANSSGGSADASQTLTMSFDDDQNIEPVETPPVDPPPPPPPPPPTGTVDIDVKPGDDEICVNPKSRGSVPVAIFGADGFDVADIDAATLSFAGLAVGMRKRGPMCSMEDVNDDGVMDLMCHFDMDAEALTIEDGLATLTGALFDGTEFSGSDEVCVVPKGRG